MSSMHELLKKIYPLRLAPVSPDADKAAAILLKELPFEVKEYPSSTEHNGWMVPMSWEVKKAEIRKEGRLIYDGMLSPLGVMGYAKSFRGRVSLDELKQHLTYRKDWPDAVGYHCDYYYKPWLSDWGFSLPYSLYQKLEPGDYDVVLETAYSKGTMKVLDFFIPGKTTDTIIFNAHNCHAGQANDDVAGMVIGVELMKRLRTRKNRYSYRLIIAPEHLGTVLYLAHLPDNTSATFKYCFFLEMLGNNNRLILQKSFLGDTLIDTICQHYLSMYCPDAAQADFRKVVGNDETVWESPGFEIPTVSLSRFPYPEYHTSMDNESIILEEKLEDSVSVLQGIVEIFENNSVIKRKFKGLIALSNPKYNLYVKPGTDPSIREQVAKDSRKWNYLMDCIPRYMDGRHSILEIAQEHQLPFREVYNYLKKFEEKGLVEFAGYVDTSMALK